MKYKYYLVTGTGSVQKAISEYIEQTCDFEEHLKKMCKKYGSEKSHVTDRILGFYFTGNKHPLNWTQKESHPQGVMSPFFRLGECKKQVAELQEVLLPNRMFFHYIFPGSVILTEGKFREPKFKIMDDYVIWMMPLKNDGTHVEIDTDGLKSLTKGDFNMLENSMLLKIFIEKKNDT